MRTRHLAAAITATLLLITLTGCSGSGDAEPTKTVTATTATSPKLSKAEMTLQCVDAVDVVADLPSTDGEVQFEPTPAPCASLSDSEYLDAYMDGIAQHNKAGQDDLQRQIDEAQESAQP